MSGNNGLVDGLAALVHPDRKDFYNCGCGWSGDSLSYADESGRSPSPSNHRPYLKGQGHCPGCGQPFTGCFA